MAHLLDTRENGEYSFVSLRETAWHQHGTVMQDEMSVDEAMNLAGHTFRVEKRPLFFENNGEMECTPNGYATVRTDRMSVLGIVTDKYKVLQNRQMWNTLEPLIDAGLARIETAGTIREGRDVWAAVQFATPNDGKFGFEGGERLGLYGIITNNHSGDRGVVTMLSAVRVVCNNTLSLALGTSKQKESTGHRGEIADKVDAAAARVFHKALAQWDANRELFAALKGITLDNETFAERVLDVVLPLGEKDTPRLKTEYDKQMERRAQLKNYWLTGKGHQGDQSAYEALNGTIEALDHNPELFIGRKSSKFDWAESALMGKTGVMKRAVTSSLSALV
jgi:phage/plasmid-like protein (TIGR03299 family)